MNPLATTDDLADRGITVPAGTDAEALLASASATVREAAGCPISQVTSTVDLNAYDWCELPLPGLPVTSVASVAVEGTTLDPSTLTSGRWSNGWRFSDGKLLLRGQTFEIPATVTVTYTHGLPTVPDDIVDLVCSMVAVAVADGYGTTERRQSFRLGDYSESFTPSTGGDSPSPFGLPDSIRARLRTRFGGGVAVL